MIFVMLRRKKQFKKNWKIFSKVVVVIVALGILAFITVGAFVAGLFFNKVDLQITQLPNASPSSETLTPFNYCTRTVPHNMEPRFFRALSLLSERTSNNNPQTASLALRFYLQPISSCLDIQYCSAAEMQGAEGLFFFDKDRANRDKLQICVSEDYKQEDDLLTATLIAHEATHAIQYVLDQTNTTYGKIYNNSCYGQEAMAFTEQTLFTWSMTQGEMESLFSRMFSSNLENSRIGGLKNLLSIALNSAQTCNAKVSDKEKASVCTVSLTNHEMEQMVKSSSYYQAQCGQ